MLWFLKVLDFQFLVCTWRHFVSLGAILVDCRLRQLFTAVNCNTFTYSSMFTAKYLCQFIISFKIDSSLILAYYEYTLKMYGSIGSEIMNRYFVVTMCFKRQTRWRRLQTINTVFLKRGELEKWYENNYGRWTLLFAQTWEFLPGVIAPEFIEFTSSCICKFYRHFYIKAYDANALNVR